MSFNFVWIIQVASILQCTLCCYLEPKIKGRIIRSVVFPRHPDSDATFCVTPKQEMGACILLPNCGVLWNQKNYALMRRSLCGFEGEVPKVCCPRSHLEQTTAVQRVTTAIFVEEDSDIFTGADDDEIFTQRDSDTFTHRSSAATVAPSRSTDRPRIAAPSTPSQRTGPKNAAPNRRRSTAVRVQLTTPSTRGNRKVNTSVVSETSLFPKDCGENSATFRRIVGGQESGVGAWPWMAAVYFARRGVKNAECGGALITPKHVVTAAHCVVNSRRGVTIDPKFISVRLGDHDLQSDKDGAQPINVNIKSVIKHDKFDPRTFQNDIALLELSNPVKFTNSVAPICLPVGEVFEGDRLAEKNGFAAGWGTISFDGRASNKLLEVQLRIWKNKDCADAFKREAPITNLNVCAGDGGKDSCRGDSGGPLMLPHTDGKFYMVGIVSFGKKCAEPGYPGVYARVTSFLEWIKEKIVSTSAS